ncbi:RNA-directed DNA polymerase, eukaryota, reverse transcriptase zinc-binding domain protein [Tanacetum coccineum]
MSSVRKNVKRQIRVPSKLAYSDYGLVNGKKNKKKQSLNDENMCNDSLESSQVDIGGEVDLGQTRVNSMVDVKNGSQTENVSNGESFVILKTGKDNENDNIVGSQGSNSQKGDKEGSKVSYAKIVNNNSLDNKLDIILTEINEDDVLSRTKFRNNEGIQSVIEMGPWMVNGKPMFMQKWDPSMSLDKSEPSKIPLWVKLRNLPLEAWTTMGISVVASRLGTPLIMDQVTTSMCKGGTGRFGFARVLIDVEAVKGIPDKVEILYKNRDGMVTGKKSVDVNYDWAPQVCSFCKVFGHRDKNCVKRPKSVEEFMEIEREELRKKQENGRYEHVRYKKKGRNKENPKGEKKINNEEYKGKKVYKLVEKVGNNEGDTSGNDVVKEHLVDKESPKTGWKVQNDIINSIRKSANKFVVLEEENKNENMLVRENEIEEEVIDVYDETSGSERKMAQKDIGFGNKNERGCRVLIGWDNEKIQGGIVHASDQAVICLFEIQSSKQRLFCTFIHAEISGKLRKKLWLDLLMRNFF